MKNEAEFKSVFKKSVRRYGGFSLPLAAPMISGIPDLFVAMPGYMAILLEAKWLGEIPREKFNRKIPFTATQLLWISTCHDVNPYTAMGLIGCIYKGKIHAIFVAYGTPQFYQLSNCFLTDCAYSVISAETKVFDVQHMFGKVPIPRLERRQVITHTEAGSRITLEPRTSKNPLAV